MWTLELKYKSFCTAILLEFCLLNLFGKLGIQIPYIFVLRGEMVKAAQKWQKSCRLCQIKNRIPKCTLDGTLQNLRQNIERCGQASAYGENLK